MRCAWQGWMVVALWLVGCAAPPAPPPRTPPAHPADAIPFAQRIPDDAPALLVAASLERLRADLDTGRWPYLLGRDWARLEQRVAREAGLDLVEPAVWVDMGIDPASPVTLAAVAPAPGGRPAPVLGLVARDPGLLRARLYAALASSIRDTEVHDDHIVLSLPGLVIALSGREVVVALGRSAQRVARRVMATPPGHSLARRPAFRAALWRTPEQPLTLRGYIDLRALVYAAAGMDSRWPGSTTAAAQAALDAHHERRLRHPGGVGAVADADAELRAARERLRDDVAAERLRALVGAVEPAGVALARGEGGWALRWACGVEPGSPFDAALSRRHPRRTAHLDGEDTLSLRAALDPKPLLAALGEETLAGEILGEETAALLTALGGAEIVLGPPGDGGTPVGVALRVEANEETARAWLARRGASTGEGTASLEVGQFGTLSLDVADGAVTAVTRSDWGFATPGPAEGEVTPLVIAGHLTPFARLLGPPAWATEGRVGPAPPDGPLAPEAQAQLEEAQARLRAALEAATERVRADVGRAFAAMGEVRLVLAHRPGELELTATWAPDDGAWLDALRGLLPGRQADLMDDPEVSAALTALEALIPRLEEASPPPDPESSDASSDEEAR